VKMNPFLHEAQKISDQMRDIRRDLHQNPELGMEEIRTSRIVADYLENLGLEIRTGVGGTGVLATLNTQEGGKTVALRADMDAIPIEDKKDVPYASKRTGVTHACGHDGHTAILLGAATLLCKFSDSLKGNVKFIFQPSEEIPPGGATAMLKDGALRNPEVDGIFSLHLHPDFPEDTVAVKTGISMASSAGFILKMIGKGGHGAALPHKIVDPIIMAGMVIVAGQTIVSRRADPLDPTAVAFSSVHGGTANNIAPDEVTLTGSLRTFEPEKREELARLLKEVAEGVAQISGGKCHLTVDMEYPSVFNHPDMVVEFRNSAAKVIHANKVINIQRGTMGGEDVGYFHQEIPGVYWYLGIANPSMGFTHTLHSPFFDFNEEVMPIGAAMHAQSAVDFLINRKDKPLPQHIAK